MDLHIKQYPLLRAALQMGLNHIPLKPTRFHEAINAASDAFCLLFNMMNLSSYNLDLEVALVVLSKLCLSKLKAAARSNKFGFRSSGTFLFDNQAVKNELNWLLSNFFISGLDKANNNASFMYIRHIRLQAYHRLMGNDFTLCMNALIWSLPTNILETIKSDLLVILPECSQLFNALPFIMATYKLHKQKCQWLTNVFQTIYSNIASLLTLAIIEVLEMFKIWCKKTRDGYNRFLSTQTSLFWSVDSILQVTLNLPEQLHDLYVADIARCYESIPLNR
jgi:hypothetical protein